MPASPKTVRTRATRSGLLAALLLVLGCAWFGQAAPVQASTAATAGAMETQLLGLINHERVADGLVSLRKDTRLATWAGNRSAWMAARGVLTHTSWDGAPCTMYAKMKITWYGCGEAIGFTSAAFGSAAATFLFNLWKASPDHQALLMSASYNYLGIGVSYRASTHTTYASILFLEGPDRSPPVARYLHQGVSGHDVNWSWTAADPLLQTHYAGFKSYDVELSVNGGAWRRARTGSTAIAVTIRNEKAGKYRLRIRARDRVGNLSAWLTSATLTVH